MSKPIDVESAWRKWQDQPDDDEAEATYRQRVAELRASHTLTAGEIVADAYRLDAPLGEGGLCTTWRATDLRTDTAVAFKVLHPRFGAKPAMVKRFHAALHLQGQVAERGVMVVRDEGGTWEGFAWGVVQLGDADLARRLPDLDELDRTQVLIDVATALHNAHAAGLAHGRLSPQNVLVDDDGGAWLTDFGLVPPNALDSPFAAPEAGDPAYRPSIVADRYAFAMLVTWVRRGGALPYWAARDPMRAIDELHVTRELREALERSSGWDPDQRPDDLGDLLRALRGDAASVRALAERAMAHERPDAALDHYRHLLAVTAGDPDVRVELAHALAQSGRERQAIDQLYAALRAPKLRHLEGALDSLRILVDRAGELPMLLHALEQRASEPFNQNDIILVEIARLKGRLHEEDEDDAWRRALEHHTRRDQAKLCLWALTETAAAQGDDDAFVSWGVRLAPLVDDAPAFAYRMGCAYERLHDPEAALHWMEKALEADEPEADVHERIEAIRSDRGDWGQVVEGLRARAAHEADPLPLLRKAARIAFGAAGDEELAAELYADIVRKERDDVEARCFLADRARRSDEPVAEREHLLLLDPASRTDELSLPERVARLVRLATLHREDGHTDDATHTVDALLDVEPSSVPGLWLKALLARDTEGDPTPSLERLATLLPPDTDDGAAAVLALADVAWRRGDRGASYDLAQRVLACRPEDPHATWAIVRATLGPDDDSQPWLRALPAKFPLREGLARLVEVTVDLGAVDVAAPPDATPLERSAAIVDALVASGGARAFLERIAQTHPDTRDLADPLVRAWSGRPDPGWSVRSLLRCNPSTRDHAARSLREPLGPPTLRSPWLGTTAPIDVDALPLREAVSLPDEPALDDDGDPTEPESDGQLVLFLHPGDVRQVRIPLVLEGSTTIGSGPSCDVRVEGLQAQHATLEVVHDAVYLVCHGEPLRQAGIATSELRLRAGMRADLDGVRIEVRRGEAEPPMLELPDLEENDEPTSVHPPEGVPNDVALFVTDGGDDYLLPLDQVTPLVDGHRLVREADGWRLEGEDNGTSHLYVVGDHFVLGEVRYALRPVLAVTPAPAPRMETTTEAVPTVVVNDGTLLGRVVALKDNRTTVGRGRGADVQLPDDTRVSRHHCAFEIRHDGTVVVVDTGSANGTFVDGEPVADERPLKPGEIIEVGDTTLEFQLGAYIEPDDLDPVDQAAEDFAELQASPTLMLPASHTKRLSLSDGRHRLAIANRALAPILLAFDDTIGPGAAAGELQFLMAASPKRYKTIFDEVEAKPTGLPALPVLHNVARLPDWEQRSLLNASLLDLLERATQRCADRLDEDACATMLGAVAASNYRKHLKL